MPHLRTRPPRSDTQELTPITASGDEISGYLEDAAHFPGGHTSAVVFPRSEAQLASVLRENPTVLPIGAQSSLTGGATPMGELVLSLSELTAVTELTAKQITIQAGVTLAGLRETLNATGKYYPPVPTYEGATVGGIVSTNAAGATTFKYGTTRDWVQGLTVMLASGEVLDLERGQASAINGRFEIESSTGRLTVPVPTYRLPAVPKQSAGYYAAANMDLIDLFVGSEGTLGIVTSVTLKVLPRCPEICFFLIAIEHEQQAIRIASDLRATSIRSRQDGDPNGLDVVAIEHLDRRSLELLREDGADRQRHISFPDNTGVVLLVQVELPSGTKADQVFNQVTQATSAEPHDGPIARLCRLLDREAVLGTTELVAPGDLRRARDLLSLREAVPEAVNRRIGVAKRTVDDTISKTAADMIVPFSKFADSLSIFRSAFEARKLDYAIWGHLSDANLHPNVIPRSVEEMRLGKEAIMECGREIIRLGGSPLAEHGVGRNPIKQALLRLLHGKTGIDQMRTTKQALDPEGKLAPGVVFPTEAEALPELPL
ncbi:MAG: lactate dehydrogenase [Acidobacteria bacterium]|nr:lactate dehydrogenase [Acidobacteriota bacterium]